jgi:hypothetical protein
VRSGHRVLLFNQLANSRRSRKIVCAVVGADGWRYLSRARIRCPCSRCHMRKRSSNLFCVS